MVIRKLKAAQFERVHQELIQNSHTRPFDASYDVDISVNGAAYLLRVQPDSHCRLAALQACKIHRDGEVRVLN